MKLNAKELRKTKPKKKNLVVVKRNPIYLILDSIIDTYNIGSLFRLADAAAIKKLYICGDSEYPPSSRIHKAAVGTEAWVPWEKRSATIKVVRELKKSGVQIIAVEQASGSISYKDLHHHLHFPCAIIVGNETNGIASEVLDESDLIIEFPMYGINKSFNVWGSAAVITYKILEKI